MTCAPDPAMPNKTTIDQHPGAADAPIRQQGAINLDAAEGRTII
jgi:hypothetical protein